MRATNPSTSRGHPVVRRFERLALSLIGALALGFSGCATDTRDLGRLSPEPAADSDARAPAGGALEKDAVNDFVRLVVGDMDATWARDFKRRGKPYAPLGPTLFGASSTCEAADNGHCPALTEHGVDLEFQRNLRERFGVEAKAPQAYAIAHQMGHHVQSVLGIDTKVKALLAKKPVATYSVEIQLELQADCFAGVWTRVTRDRELLAPMDVERALRQASELGKELLLARKKEGASGETFTYAIPRRRGYWFYQGFASGRIDDCDTFKPD